MYKSLDMNLVPIKKHKFILQKRSIFLFSDKIIPITNQRTDSHPCIRFLHPMDFKIGVAEGAGDTIKCIEAELRYIATTQSGYGTTPI